MGIVGLERWGQHFSGFLIGCGHDDVHAPYALGPVGQFKYAAAYGGANVK